MAFLKILHSGNNIILFRKDFTLETVRVAKLVRGRASTHISKTLQDKYKYKWMKAPYSKRD